MAQALEAIEQPAVEHLVDLDVSLAESKANGWNQACHPAGPPPTDNQMLHTSLPYGISAEPVHLLRATLLFASGDAGAPARAIRELAGQNGLVTTQRQGVDSLSAVSATAIALHRFRQTG